MSFKGCNPVAPRSSQLHRPGHRITLLTDGLVRFESTHGEPNENDTFEDRSSTFAINRDFPTPKHQLRERDDGGLEVVTDRFHLVWDGKAFSPSGLTVLLRNKGTTNTGWSHVWRYGERHFKMTNLGGTYRTLDRIDGRCELDDGTLSQYGFAVLDDSGSMLFTSDGWVAARDKSKVDLYLFAYGLDYRAALKAFYMISGKTPLVPRWALGNWWSRYYAYTEEAYLALMDHFQEESIPMSVAVIDMDWHPVHIPGDFGTGWTGYTWNTELFPDPAAFLKTLKDRGLKSTLNVHPADGVRPFEKLYPAMCEALGRDPAENLPITFDCTDKKFFDAYFKVLHHTLEDEGVDFWWLDWQQGPHSGTAGIDPLWMLNHFHYLDSGRKGERRMTFSRYGGPGSHRYPVGFSGDTITTWESLDFQPEFTASASNIGYGWWSHDIGGHYHGTKDDELYTRWVQLGVFSPLLRLHSSESPFNSREPWVYNTEAKTIVAEAMQYRHRLVPYLYSCAVSATVDDKNIVEPVYYDYPEVAEAYRFRNQFNFGSQLTVFPITTPRRKSTGMAKSEGWLPPGRWVDIFTGTVYDGDRIISFHRPLSLYPVLAKEGAIIILDAAEGKDLKNGCPLPGALEVLLVVGADGEFELVEDDGTGAGIDDVKFSKTKLTFEQSSGTLTIGPTSNALLQQRSWSVRVLSHSIAGTSSITAKVNNTPIPLDIPDQSLSPSTPSKDSPSSRVIPLGSHPSSSTLTLTLSPDPQLDAADIKSAIFDLLTRANIAVDLKGDLWNALSGLDDPQTPLGMVLSRVTVIGRGTTEGEETVQAIEELLLADLRGRK